MSKFLYEPPIPVEGTVTLQLTASEYRALYNLLGRSSPHSLNRLGLGDSEIALLDGLYSSHWKPLDADAK